MKTNLAIYTQFPTLIDKYRKCSSFTMDDLFKNDKGEYIKSFEEAEASMWAVLEKISPEDLAKWKYGIYPDNDARNCFKGDWFELFSILFLNYYGRHFDIKDVKKFNENGYNGYGCDLIGKSLDGKREVYIQSRYNRVRGYTLSHAKNKIGRIVSFKQRREAITKPKYEGRCVIITTNDGLNPSTKKHYGSDLEEIGIKKIENLVDENFEKYIITKLNSQDVKEETIRIDDNVEVNHKKFWGTGLLLLLMIGFVVSIFPQSYEFYKGMRWLACGTFLWLGYSLYADKSIAVGWCKNLCLGIIAAAAVLYNPIMPVYLYVKEYWMVANLLSAGFVGFCITKYIWRR